MNWFGVFFSTIFISDGKKSIVLKNIGSSLTKKYIKSFYMGEMFVLYDIKMIHYSKIKKLHEFISLINLC